MMKKTIILLLCLMLVMPASVLAAEGDLPVLEKPPVSQSVPMKIMTCCFA